MVWIDELDETAFFGIEGVGCLHVGFLGQRWRLVGVADGVYLIEKIGHLLYAQRVDGAWKAMNMLL